MLSSFVLSMIAYHKVCVTLLSNYCRYAVFQGFCQLTSHVLASDTDPRKCILNTNFIIFFQEDARLAGIQALVEAANAVRNVSY